MNNSATEAGIKLTRDPSEGRGVIGRGELMAEAREKFEAERQMAKIVDGEKIHEATERGVAKVQSFVETVGGGVERFVKFGDRIYRGAEATVKKAAENGWEAVKGFGEDTWDVLVNSGKVVFGAGVAAVAVPAAAVVVGTEHLAVGLVELGQRGAAGVAELRGRLSNLVTTGVRAAAAAVEARNLALQGHVADTRQQNQDRLASIQSAYLGPKVAAIGKEVVKNYFKG